PNPLMEAHHDAPYCFLILVAFATACPGSFAKHEGAWLQPGLPSALPRRLARLPPLRLPVSSPGSVLPGVSHAVPDQPRHPSREYLAKIHPTTTTHPGRHADPVGVSLPRLLPATPLCPAEGDPGSAASSLAERLSELFSAASPLHSRNRALPNTSSHTLSLFF